MNYVLASHMHTHTRTRSTFAHAHIFPNFKHMMHSHTQTRARGVVYGELTGGLNGSECLLNEMGDAGRAARRVQSI